MSHGEGHNEIWVSLFFFVGFWTTNFQVPEPACHGPLRRTESTIGATTGDDRTNQYLRWVGRKSGSTFIAQNNLWLAGRLLWMFGIFWMAPARGLGRRCRNRSDLVGACYDHYVNRFFGAPAALVGCLFTIERNRSGRLCFALFGLSRSITISRAQKDSRRVGDNFGVVLLCFTNLVWQIWKGFRTVRYLILGGFVLFFWRLLDSLRFDLDK